MGSGIFLVVVRTTEIASLFQVVATFLMSKWRRKCIENGNLVKNKDGDSSFLPELQRRQNDNMAIPEIQ